MNLRATLRRSISPSLVLQSLAILILALIPRLSALNRYVTPDELKWTERSIHFSDALSRGDWAATLQAGHPGVMTMWLGSLGILVQRTIEPAITPALDAVARSATLNPQDPAAIRAIAPFLTAARWPVIIGVSINLMLLLAMLSRLIERRAAFLATALVALDPFNVALGSLLHVDALLVSFSLLALTAVLIALDRSSTRWFIAAGAWAGLAVLSKSPALVLLPVTGLVLLTAVLTRRLTLKRAAVSFSLFVIVHLSLFIAFYPAMWTAPFDVVTSLAGTAQKFSETAHAVNYFAGSRERDPGAVFYLAVLALRSTPVLWLGLLAFGALLIRAKSQADLRLRRAAWPFWIWAILFLGVITLGAKKLDRYVLPTLEALNVIGAFGLAFMIDFLTRPGEAFGPKPVKRRLIANASPLLLMLVATAQFLAVWPLTLRAYNPLLGGYGGASAVLPVGGGESAEVARQLNASAFGSRSIATTDIVGTAPFFVGTLWPATVEGFAKSDFLLFNASDVQLTPDTVNNWIGNTSPVMTLTVQSQPFAWLYENAWLKADQLRVAQRQADDAVIVDAAGTALPVPAEATTIVTSALTADQAVELLQKISQSQRRVFVYHFANQPDRNTLELFRALDTYAVNLDEWASPLSRGGLYALPEPSAFAIQPLSLNGEVTFGDRIHLSTIQTVLTRVQPGQSISFVSQWQATGADAQLSVSLLDDAGHVWSTTDTNVPIAAQANISRQRRFTLPVPLTIPPGEYQLLLNVIDVASGSPLRTRSGAVGGTDWPLGTITIDPAQTLVYLATRIPPIAINADLGGSLRFIGSEQPPAPVTSGDPWTLSMEWTALADHLPALDVQWQVVKTDGTLAYSTTLPLNPYSTDRWRKGDVLQSKYDFRLPATLTAGTYSLDFLVLNRATRQPLEPRPTRLAPIEIAVRSRSFTAPTLTYPTHYRFDQLTTLIGAQANRAGNIVTITMYWQANAITSTNYTAFVQIVRPNGEVVTQIDRWQIGGDAPTSTWVQAQIVADAYAFDVPDGEYQVWLGLYNAANGQRLPATNAAGQRIADDKVLVFTLK